MNKLFDVNDNIKIEFLGGFTISYKGSICIQDTGTSKKVMNLIQYLIVNRKNKIVYDRIIAALKISDDSKSPAAVLKNLVYRARLLLKNSGLPEFDYIIQDSGSYSWNNEVPCQIDTEIFEDYYNKAKHSKDITLEERLSYYKNAIQVYGGKFLPKNSLEIWIVPITTYYERLFKECLSNYYELMGEDKNYNAMIPLCKKAIEIDQFDEDAYIIMIECYCNLGKYNEALSAYEKITDLLYDELGVKPSDRLMALYELAMGQLNYVEKNLIKIDGSLREASDEVNGAYYCTFGLFKAISQFTLRMFVRTGQSLCMILFTISDNKGDMPNKKKRTQTMEILKECISSSLRSGDIFAQFSPTQYIVLLIGANYENSGQAAQRVMDRYNSLAHSRIVKVTYKVKVVEVNKL